MARRQDQSTEGSAGQGHQNGPVGLGSIHDRQGIDGELRLGVGLRSDRAVRPSVPPAYVAKASSHTVNLPQYGMVWSFEQRNAIQSDYRITFAPEQ
jgi:hypothetical protein